MIASLQAEHHNSSKCADWGPLGLIGQCCSTKCSGVEDMVYDGTFYDCKAGRSSLVIFGLAGFWALNEDMVIVAIWLDFLTKSK